MTTATLVSMLGWSMVVNFIVLAIWAFSMLLMPGVVYRLQRPFAPISRDDWQRVMYRLIGQYKILLLVTHVGPYLALRIMQA